MNKKAQEIFSIVMLLVFIPLLFITVTKLSKIDSKTETIGATTLELKEVYEKVENALFYIEQSGLYSVKSIGCNQNITTQFNQELDKYALNYPDKIIQFPKEYFKPAITALCSPTFLLNFIYVNSLLCSLMRFKHSSCVLSVLQSFTIIICILNLLKVFSNSSHNREIVCSALNVGTTIEIEL